ncbi:uncharacterized protein LOC126737305 isoform X2 [Anthonomus grandis grandis]|nr:uncharacterized protein LOC126737305 isoform X2 [Anthonomus grandis grandis]
MQNKPKCRYPSARFLNATSKPLKDIPIPMDLSREINLTSFNIKSKKQERISEYMCRNIRKTKLKALKRSAKIDVGPTIPRPSSGVDFKSFLEKCPITDMSRFLEKSIRCKINAQVLEKRFPHILNEIMKDTKAEYKRVTHYAGINLKIKEKFGEDFTIRNYKFLGKTENYDKFLCTKKQFGMRWVLHYGIMRNFLKGCVVGLPYQLFEIEITNIIDLDDLRHIFREKINSCSITFHDFHKKMNLLFDKPDTAYKKKPSMFLPACTKLFSIYVSKCIAHTMESIVEYTKSVDKPPYLNLYVDFNENLDLAPTEEEVIQIFHKLLDDIISTGEDLHVMEKGRLKGYESKKIFLCLTEEFIQDCKTKIRNNIGELYEPILNFLENLGSDFREIYSDINSNNFASAMDTLFEDGCKKIQYYKKFLHKVAYIPNKEYFKIGHLDLLMYREKLYSSLQLISESIFKNLASQHLWEINDICESFKLIKIRASTKPITTEELIEIGKFMTWVKNEQLEDLNQRVYDALKSLCNIITLGILEEDHMKKNSAAMNWIDDIKPIIEQHSTVYEQLKFEAEEKLQKVIEEINVLIVDMHPLLVILDEMDNIKLARKYLSQITLHMTKIKEIHMKIDWINSEEVCLNFPKSSYVDFENLKDYVHPFYHLLKLSLDVQKNVSVWQYGQFDLLEYDSAQQTVQKFCKELIEIQKYYRKKLRQAQDENLPIR